MLVRGLLPPSSHLLADELFEGRVRRALLLPPGEQRGADGGPTVPETEGRRLLRRPGPTAPHDTH